MINEQLEKIFIENLKANIGKNKPIEKDDIIYFAQEYGIEVNKRESIDKILDKILENDLLNKLYETFNEFVYIPSWKVAKYFKLETNELDMLLFNNLIEANTKVGSFYSRESKCNVSYDLYSFDTLFKYESEQLKDIYNKAFNRSKYNIRLETINNTNDVQIVINELQKIFKVSNPNSYEHRNKQGYYTYFNIELMNNSKEETNVLLNQVNRLKKEVEDLRDRNMVIESQNSSLKDFKMLYERLKLKYEKLKIENNNLQNEIEGSRIKNERGGGRKPKFNNEQVNTILEARNEGKSIRSLAKEFNCSIGLVHKIIKEHDRKE